jgi:hypothetical protein
MAQEAVRGLDGFHHGGTAGGIAHLRSLIRPPLATRDSRRSAPRAPCPG